MHNLLIVDDEVAIINGFAYDIEWETIGIDHVFQAYSGKMAMDILVHYRIDVIIADIRMPETDGIQLAEEVSKRWPMVKVIFMSGYDDFVYAQKAIHLKVFRYLTKPSSYEEVFQTVAEAIEEFNKELAVNKMLENASIQLQNMLPILQEKYLNNWIVLGMTSPMQECEKWKVCKLPISLDKPAFIMILSIGGQEGGRARENGSLEYAIINMATEILLCKNEAVHFADNGDNIVFIVQKEESADLMDCQRYIQEMGEVFFSVVASTLKCPVVVSLGNVVMPEGLFNAYHSLLSRAHRVLIQSQGVIIGPDTDRQEAANKPLISLLSHSALATLVESFQKDRCLKFLQEVFDIVENGGEQVPYDVLLQIYSMVLYILVSESHKNGVAIEDWAVENRKALYSFERIRSLAELKSWCRNMVAQYIDYMTGREKSNNWRLVQKAKKIMQEYLVRDAAFNQDLSLEEIASYLYIHPNYLSSLFKEVEGITVTSYLIRLRMEKAKEYLKEPGVRIYEISERLGYKSIAHFNRIFKREVGITPKEYQASIVTDV